MQGIDVLERDAGLFRCSLQTWRLCAADLDDFVRAGNKIRGGFISDDPLMNDE